MEQKDLQARALKVFKAHKMDKVYMTADGQAFTVEPAKTNANLELATKDDAINYEEQKELLEDRAFLFARHEMLTGAKPTHNIGTEKLAERVQELEKEKFNPEKTE